MAILDNSLKKSSLYEATKELNDSDSLTITSPLQYIDSSTAIKEFVNSSFNLRESVCKFNGRIKIYPNGMVKRVCVSRPIFNPYKVESSCKPKSKKIANELNKRTNRSDNLKRAKEKCFDIACMNDFEYFITFTLNEKLISRTNVDEIRKALCIWLSNQVQRYDVCYLILAEYHADREAIHFHGLLKGKLKLIDSGHKTKNGRTIYNLESWKYGFTNAVLIEGDYIKVANYITKYITKDCEKILGKRYLAGGKGLIRNVPTDYFNFNYAAFKGKEFAIPAAGLAFKYNDLEEDFSIYEEIDLFD